MQKCTPVRTDAVMASFRSETGYRQSVCRGVISCGVSAQSPCTQRGLTLTLHVRIFHKSSGFVSFSRLFRRMEPNRGGGMALPPLRFFQTDQISRLAIISKNSSRRS